MPLPPEYPAILAMGIIEVDGTFVVQMGLFVVLFFILRRLLFRPALETIRLREERTVGARGKAAQASAEADEHLARYEDALRGARREALAARRELRDDGAARRNEALDAARSDCAKLLEESRTDLERATAEAKAGIDESAQALSRQIVARLLGRAAVVLLCLLPAATAWASGDGSDGWQHDFLVRTMWTALNVALLLWLVVRFGKRPAHDFLANRRAEIMRELDEATALRSQAEALLAEYETRIEGLDAERARLLVEFREAGEAEKARLVEEGSAASERMREEARRAIDQEIRKTKLELEGAVLDLAVARATEVLATEAGPSDQRVLVAEFLTRVKSLPGAEA